MVNNAVATLVAARPDPWGEAPEGFHFEAYEQPDWIAPACGAGRCRYGRPSCKKPAVATLMRSYCGRNGFARRPWDYCEEHLYGGWIEGGKVMRWRLVRHDGGDIGADLARIHGAKT